MRFSDTIEHQNTLLWPSVYATLKTDGASREPSPEATAQPLSWTQ